MKELTIEEKAKCYDEAIERAKAYQGLRSEMEIIFPELKENGDEKMMNQLHSWMKEFGGAEEYTEKVYNWLQGLIKVQCEQKPADKVEPKFKVGDWVVYQNNTFRVQSLSNGTLILQGEKYQTYFIEELCRLWTIQDAKDGDVLSDGTTIFIFKDLLSDGSVMSYCDYDTDSDESDALCPLSMNLMCSKITPATKEQRDKLEKAMTDRGYTFDFEKKELKKIEQNPAWSEEDEEIYRKCICAMRASACGFPEEEKFVEQVDNWLKSLKLQSTWKPSEEMLEALYRVISENEDEILLDKLYQGLKYGKVLSEK